MRDFFAADRADRPGTHGKWRASSPFGVRGARGFVFGAAFFALARPARADRFFEPQRRNLGDALVDGGLVLGELGVGGVTLEILYPGFWATWSPARVGANFADPLGRADLGFRLDRDGPFFNSVAHTVGWSLQAMFLMERGHGWLATLVITQASSLFWEFVVEGGRGPPSGRDLGTNLAWSLIGICIALVAERGEQVAAHSWLGRIVRWLNPFHALDRLL